MTEQTQVQMTNEDFIKKLQNKESILELAKTNFKSPEKPTLFKSFDFIKPEYKSKIYNPKLGENNMMGTDKYVSSFNFLPPRDIDQIGLCKKINTWTYYDATTKAYYNEIDLASLGNGKDPVRDFLAFKFPIQMRNNLDMLKKSLQNTPIYFSYIYLNNDNNIDKENLKKVWIYPFKSQIFNKISSVINPIDPTIEPPVNPFTVVNSPNFILKIESNSNVSKDRVIPNYNNSNFDFSKHVSLKEDEMNQIGCLNDIFLPQSYATLKDRFIAKLQKNETYSELAQYFQDNFKG